MELLNPLKKGARHSSYYKGALKLSLNTQITALSFFKGADRKESGQSFAISMRSILNQPFSYENETKMYQFIL